MRKKKEGKEVERKREREIEKNKVPMNQGMETNTEVNDDDALDRVLRTSRCASRGQSEVGLNSRWKIAHNGR